MNAIQPKFDFFNPIQERVNLVSEVAAKLRDCIQKEKIQRRVRFAFFAFCVMIINAALDFLRGMHISGMLILAMALNMAAAIFVSSAGYKKITVPLIIISINLFLVAISFFEGLKSGSYMQILVLLFTLSYLSADESVTKRQAAIYFFITAASFCTCIIFFNQTNAWQQITAELYHQMYIFHCVSAVLICGLFAGVNMHVEKKYKLKYAEQKTKVELLKLTIVEQNKHLKEIAYTGSHVVRKPLANILALTEILNRELNNNSDITDIINHLEISSKCLDEAIKEIVYKTKHEHDNPETFLLRN